MKWKPFNSGTPYTCRDCPAYAEIQAERDKWRSIANQLVNGAERQIDDLREMLDKLDNPSGVTTPSNVYWVAAWRRHDEAVRCG
jgi:hypothetical protein